MRIEMPKRAAKVSKNFRTRLGLFPLPSFTAKLFASIFFSSSRHVPLLSLVGLHIVVITHSTLSWTVNGRAAEVAALLISLSDLSTLEDRIRPI
jgi:hypothetical protein